jgi:hypothetical protein
VTIIKADKAKNRTYCNIKKLGKQMERAHEKRNIKLVYELFQKIESLEKTLGPEYVALVDRLGAIDPENDKLIDEITSLFEPLDRRCTSRLRKPGSKSKVRLRRLPQELSTEHFKSEHVRT